METTAWRTTPDPGQRDDDCATRTLRALPLMMRKWWDAVRELMRAAPDGEPPQRSLMPLMPVCHRR